MGVYYDEGPYWGKIIRQAMGETRNGNPQFVLTFEVVGKVDPTDPTGELISCKKYERSVFRVITEKTMPYFVEDLEVLEFTKPSFKFLDPNVDGFVDFSGREMEFYCSHKEYEGQLREQWGISGQQKQMEIKPLEPKKLRDLDNLYGKQLKGLAKAAPAPPVDKTPMDVNAAMAEAVAAEDADIPF
jgi:hypothetical protein